MKQYFLALVISCLLFSCDEKSLEIPGAVPPSSGGTGGTTPVTPTSPVALGTIVFTLDGVAQAYNVSALASNVTLAGTTLLSITGFKEAVNKDQILIGIQSDDPALVGTYTDTSTTAKSVAMLLKDATGQYVSNNLPDAPTVVTVTAISSTTVEGNFKGDLQLANSDGTYGRRVSVKNGRFNVKIQK